MSDPGARYGSVSAPFIRRPIATSLLAAAIFLAGALAYTFLPVAPLPQIDMPVISVTGMLPGASPETMASSVATPLERRFGRIAGVNELTSTSSLGSSTVTMQFDLNRDIDGAARDVQAAISASAAELPPNLPTLPTYRKVNPADSPVMIVSLTSDSVPLPQIYDAANTILAQKVAQVRGVGNVFVGGCCTPAVRIQVDPIALAGLSLSLDDVRAVIASSTANQPKGAVSGVTQTAIISSNDQLLRAKDYADLVLHTNGQSTVKLGDIATVKDDVENARLAAWVNGKPTIVMVIFRQPGANIIETNERVRKLLPSLKTSISPAIDLDVAMDRTKTIRGSVKDVEETLFLSVILVTIVVFVFLRTFRATAIPSIAVPLSLVGTFGLMYLFGYSLDNLSLMALTISTGFVVDDAIVVTENVMRHIETGVHPIEAAFRGAKEIGFTIVSITVSLLAVFIPILMMGGIVGRLFREFAVTLCIAIAFSAVVSLTLTPMMCSRFLKPHTDDHGRLYNMSERGFASILALYSRALRWVLRHQRFMLFVTAGTVALTVYLYIAVPHGLFPQQDTGLIMAQTEAPQDVSFPSMRERQLRANEAVYPTQISKDDPAYIEAHKNFAHIVSFVGGGFGSSAGNTGRLYLDLGPKPARKMSADDIVNALRPKLSKVEGIKFYPQAAQDFRVGGRSAKTQYQYSIQDASLDELEMWAPRILEKLKTVAQIKDVVSDQQTEGLELNVNVDRDTASRLGISAKNVDDALYDAFGQRFAATMYKPMNEYHVVLEVKPEFQKSPDSLGDVYVDTANAGAPARLASFAKVTQDRASLSISHSGQFPCVTISFNLAPGVSLGDAIPAIHKAERDIGAPPGLIPTFSGTAQAFQESLSSEPLLIAAALFAVYIVLGMLYESYVHPITILSTIPSAGIGALAALIVCKSELDVISLIGIILLIGIVKKNAILMIDFALEKERTEGLSPVESIYQACVLRFRPITMTTLAALLGGLPLALGNGEGAEVRKPLGISIVGGLIISQMLTLFTTPVVYLALDKFTRRKKAMKIARSNPPPAPVPAE